MSDIWTWKELHVFFQRKLVKEWIANDLNACLFGYDSSKYDLNLIENPPAIPLLWFHKACTRGLKKLDTIEQWFSNF